MIIIMTIIVTIVIMKGRLLKDKQGWLKDDLSFLFRLSTMDGYLKVLSGKVNDLRLAGFTYSRVHDALVGEEQGSSKHRR